MSYKQGEVQKERPDFAILLIGYMVLISISFMVAAWFALWCLQNYWLDAWGKALRLW